MEILEQDNKQKEIEHHIPTSQRKRLTIGFLVGTKELAVIQPERPQDTLTLLSGGKKMDFTGRGVNNDRPRTTKTDRTL